MVGGDWGGMSGAGERTRERLADLGIHRPEDLLTHLPLRYEDRSRLTPLGALRPGMSAYVQGNVLASETTRGRRPMLLVRLGDGTGQLGLRFFHFSFRLRQVFVRNRRFVCYGEVRGGSGGLELVHPSFTAVAEGKPIPLADRLTPIYPTVSGLGQARLQRLIDAALAALGAAELEGYRLSGLDDEPALEQAFNLLHHPLPGFLPAADCPARRRLARDEILAHYLVLRDKRARSGRSKAVALFGGNDLRQRLMASLAFRLTAAQRRVDGEIGDDLARERPMRRLLQGDVGSGKTVVAALAVARALGAGYPAALMAPTGLLAEQHFRILQAWFEPLGVAPVFLTATTSAAERRALGERLARGEPLLVVGTHALITGKMSLPRLALAIVDEQHRFGVDQRLALGGPSTHQLVMTATPIPRTLAMTLYADLDVSLLDERPPGRQPVKTAVMSETRRVALVERIRREIAAGRQAYWVCPLVEESATLAAQAAERAARELAESLPEVRIGLVHGRLQAIEKEAIMRRFADAKLDILVATTVIEVGVDVTNATLMVVENSERMGLAQLHQLRGRIGRGTAPSHCILLYRPPLTVPARERLEALRGTEDGFAIAEADLRLRGPGEFIGTRQAGFARLRVADFDRDQALFEQTPDLAERLLAQDPTAAEALKRFWIGPELRYADA